MAFQMSAPTGNKSKQFNQSQGQYLGNLAGMANQAQNTSQEKLGQIDSGLGQYQRGAQALFNPAMAQQEQRRFGDVMDQGQATLGGLLQHPGYTPQEQQGMRLGTTIPMESAFNTAGYQTRNSAALNGNAGAGMAAAAQLAREKARMSGAALGGLQQQFGDARRADTQSGLNQVNQMAGMSLNANQNQQQALQQFQFPSTLQAQIYGQNLGVQQNALQQQGQATQMYQQRSMQPGFLKQAALGGISGLAGGAGAALGKVL